MKGELLEFELPVRIDSLNRGLRQRVDNLAAIRRQRFGLVGKVKKLRTAAFMTLLAESSPFERAWLLGAERVVITLTRIAPGTLDSEDNLHAGFKPVRDGLAGALGLDDGDDRFRWLYGQEKAGRGVYSARVTIEGMSKAEFARRLVAREEATA